MVAPQLFFLGHNNHTDLDQGTSGLKSTLAIPFFNHRGMAIRFGVVVRCAEYVLSIVVPTIHESPEKFEIAECIRCFIFTEYLIVAYGPHVHCKYYSYLALEAGQHCHQTRFPLKAKTFSRLSLFNWSQKLNHAPPMETVRSKQFFVDSNPGIYHTRFQLSCDQLTRDPFSSQFQIFFRFFYSA